MKPTLGLLLLLTLICLGCGQMDRELVVNEGDQVVHYNVDGMT